MLRATPKVKHKNLSQACLPRYKVKHKSLNNVCYKPPVRIRHQDLSNKCYPKMVIKHKDYSKFSCTELRIQHTDLNKVKVLCDPNIRDHTTTMERVGKEVKFLFTRHRKFLQTRESLFRRFAGKYCRNLLWYSGSGGLLVVKKNTYYPIKIIVSVPKDKPRTEKGEPREKFYKLTKEETKEIMIRELIKRQKYIWLVRMYPEERVNLDQLKELYNNPGGTPNDPNAPTDPPPSDVPILDNN